jgi:hypothetical protein
MTEFRNREVADLVEKQLEDGKPMEHVVLDFRWGAWKTMVASMLVHAIQGVTRGTVLRAAEQQGIVNALDPVVQESAREAADEGVLEYLPKEAPAEEGYEEDVLVESTTDQRKGGLADLYQDEPDDRKRKRHKKKKEKGAESAKEKDAESAEGSESESASSSHSPRESARQQPRRVLEGKLITFVEKRFPAEAHVILDELVNLGFFTAEECSTLTKKDLGRLRRKLGEGHGRVVQQELRGMHAVLEKEKGRSEGEKRRKSVEKEKRGEEKGRKEGEKRRNSAEKEKWVPPKVSLPPHLKRRRVMSS